MDLAYNRKFKKAYKKLIPAQKKQVINALRKFVQNPYDASLQNHRLKGEMNDKRAIHAGFDLCIVYRMEGGYKRVELLNVGNHENVYKQ